MRSTACATPGDEDCDGFVDEDCDFGPADCPAGSNVVLGTPGADHIVGSAGCDCILGYGGDDTLVGGNGDDVLAGGPGDDALTGGNGTDRLLGGAGDDTLGGGNGADTILGGAGNDDLAGDNGADALMGGDGHDVIAGGGGGDAIDGGGGADFIVGGSGPDAIEGGGGPDACDDPGVCEGTGSSVVGCMTDADCVAPERCVANVNYCASPTLVAFEDPTCDGIDDDNDGVIDDDYVGAVTSCGVGACGATGMLTCIRGAVVDTCEPGTPAASDASCDGVDDDCNGATDDGYVASATNCGVGACRASGMLVCVGGAAADTCEPGTPAPSDSTCNGEDDDCNGATDDGYVAPQPTCGSGTCSSTGQLLCAVGMFYNTCRPPADGTACSAPNAAQGECSAGACEVLTCAGSFGDCDSLATNGCETDLGTDPLNCGGCGVVCDDSESCDAGACLGSGLPLGAGLTHSCAVVESGRVQCWGDNAFGQLGDGTQGNDRVRPVYVVGLNDAVGVSAGRTHTCATRADGRVACWGRNSDGQLGDGSYNGSRVPVAVTGVTDAVAIAAGAIHTCAARAGGKVMCWGSGDEGKLGIPGAPYSTPFPVQVANLTDAVAVSAGEGSSCALRATGQVACWGSNRYFEVGDCTRNPRETPFTVSGISDAMDVSIDTGHTCVVHAAGHVSCWGLNGVGQLGRGFTSFAVCSPGRVANLADAVAVSTSRGGDRAQTCAVRATGAVMCWGSNDFGQLGTGNTANSSVPVQVLELTNAVDVACGNAHTCASLADGTVACWGQSDEGQVGDGTTFTHLDPQTTSLLP